MGPCQMVLDAHADLDASRLGSPRVVEREPLDYCSNPDLTGSPLRRFLSYPYRWLGGKARLERSDGRRRRFDRYLAP